MLRARQRGKPVPIDLAALTARQCIEDDELDRREGGTEPLLAVAPKRPLVDRGARHHRRPKPGNAEIVGLGERGRLPDRRERGQHVLDQAGTDLVAAEVEDLLSRPRMSSRRSSRSEPMSPG